MKKVVIRAKKFYWLHDDKSLEQITLLPYGGLANPTFSRSNNKGWRKYESQS